MDFPVNTFLGRFSHYQTLADVDMDSDVDIVPPGYDGNIPRVSVPVGNLTVKFGSQTVDAISDIDVTD